MIFLGSHAVYLFKLDHQLLFVYTKIEHLKMVGASIYMQIIKFIEKYFYSYLILLWFVYSRSCSAKLRFVGLLDRSVLMFKMTLRFLKKKTESDMGICLSDTLFLAYTLSPEGKILAVHVSGSTVSPCGYTCSRLQPDRSFILLPSIG